MPFIASDIDSLNDWQMPWVFLRWGSEYGLVKYTTNKDISIYKYISNRQVHNWVYHTNTDHIL